MDETPEQPVLPDAEDLMQADDETAEALVVEYAEACIRLEPGDPFSAFALLSKGVRYVYSTALLEGEVESGGFNQYFYNVSSDYALEALEGYRRFKAVEHARLLRRAIAIFHHERWFHFRIKQRHSLDAFFDSYRYTNLSTVDEAFYELEEDIVALRSSYIRANLDQFTS